MSDEPHENHGYFALSDKGLVNSIVAHLSPTSGQNAAIAEMQRRQMEATRSFNAAAHAWVRESAVQTAKIIQLTEQMHMLTVAMFVLGLLQSRDDQSKTKARLAVIAYTGLPHALIKQLTPEAIDWRAKTVQTAKRRKGKGVEARQLPLTGTGLEALRRFAALEAWGEFSNSSMLKSWKRACKAAKVVPAPRVYDLRHSFATTMYAATGDPKATAQMLMHSEKSQMMDRYTIGGVAPRLKLAVGAFDAAVSAGKSGAKRLAVTAGRYRQRRKQA